LSAPNHNDKLCLESAGCKCNCIGCEEERFYNEYYKSNLQRRIGTFAKVEV